MNILGICTRITQLPHLLGGDIHGFHSFMSGNTKKKHIHPLPGKPWVHTTQKLDSQVSTKYHGSSRPSRSCFHQGRKHSDFPINHCSCLHLALVLLLTPVSPPPDISLLCAHEELCNSWSRDSSAFHRKHFSWTLCFFISDTNRHCWPLPRASSGEVFILLL